MNVSFIPSVCSYCGTGCHIIYHVHNNKIIACLPDPLSQVSGGGLCIKGWHQHEFVHSENRLTKCLRREPGENSFVEVSWNEALRTAAEKLQSIIAEYGPDSVAVLSSARITNEENYLAQKFARTVIGTNNIDHCARLCHSPSVAGLAASLGSGAMTNSLEDLEESQCILVIGSNTSECHPLVASRIMKAKQRGSILLTVDPRPTQMALIADKWINIIPGTDVALMNAMAHIIMQKGLYDETVADTTEDFHAFKDHVLSLDLEKLSKATGVSVPDIEELALQYARHRPSAMCYAMGITQYASGTERVQACSNLALLTGSIGIRGGGINPLRGQNNVQGACDMGALPDVYPSYRKVADEQARADIESYWHCHLPERPGLPLTKLPQAINAGSVKALYIIGENPLLSDPDVHHLAEALHGLEFLLVQDIFLTETAVLADVVLPAAAAPEKDGTFTNTERRCSLLHKAVAPPGEALADGEILCRLASSMGKEWRWSSSMDVFNEMRAICPSYAGMTYDRLKNGGLQWPCPDEDHPGTPILHMHGVIGGKGKFFVLDLQTPKELPDDEYPFILSTGRNFAHYHTASMTGVSPTLRRQGGLVYVEIHPDDAHGLSAKNGQTLKISSRRGSIYAQIRITPGIKRGTVFVPFHYKEGPANVLTLGEYDPVCGIPEYKHCAVKVEHVD